MEDKKKIIYTKYDPKTDWLSRGHYTSVFPILEQPAKSRNYIFGAGFFIIYKEKKYVVTAKHVVDIDNPVLLLTGINREDIFLATDYFKKIGQDWIFHEREDLAILKFNLPSKFKRINNSSMIPKTNKIYVKPNQIVRHLGYPDKKTGHWSDNNAPNNIPTGGIGKIIKVSPTQVLVSTPAHYGDSGAPLFLKVQNKARLIGVITKTRVIKKGITPTNGIYLGQTSGLPISLVYDLIDSN